MSRYETTSLIQTLTVGIGISPIRQLALFADCTAGRDFHPALKCFCSIVWLYYNTTFQKCNT